MSSIDKSFYDLNDESGFGLFFQEPKELQFLDVEFDFKINPDHFIEWLKLEDDEISGENYSHDVSSMCEYGCLYIAMMLNGQKLQNEPLIYYGKFGFFEHFWIGYVFNREEYFIDLTLQQFRKDAPKFSVIKALNEKGSYTFLSDGYPINEYLKDKEAFRFYTNPKTMKKPKDSYSWQEMERKRLEIFNNLEEKFKEI